MANWGVWAGNKEFFAIFFFFYFLLKGLCSGREWHLVSLQRKGKSQPKCAKVTFPGWICKDSSSAWILQSQPILQLPIIFGFHSFSKDDNFCHGGPASAFPVVQQPAATLPAFRGKTASSAEFSTGSSSERITPGSISHQLQMLIYLPESDARDEVPWSASTSMMACKRHLQQQTLSWWCNTVLQIDVKGVSAWTLKPGPPSLFWN